MSLKRKFISLITMALTVVAFSTFAAAQEETTDKAEAPTVKERRGEGRQRGFAQGRKGHHRGMRGMHGGGRGLMRSLRGIELTEGQRIQIKSMLEAQRAGNQQQHEELRDLFTKKRDGSITETESLRFDQIKGDMRASSDQLKNSILALLNPEQNQKLEQLRVEREQFRQERRQKREERRQQMREQKPTDN